MQGQVRLWIPQPSFTAYLNPASLAANSVVLLLVLQAAESSVHPCSGADDLDESGDVAAAAALLAELDSSHVSGKHQIVTTGSC